MALRHDPQPTPTQTWEKHLDVLEVPEVELLLLPPRPHRPARNPSPKR